MKKLSSLSLAILALAATGAARADEGMWMPSQLPQIAAPLKAAGLALDPAKLKELTQFPMNAVISLGGCTASFVSPQGLVVTNHHCAYGSIQYNSRPERDLIKNGFLAATMADELPAAPGSRVFVTVDVKDVTDRVLDAKTSALTGKARVDAMEANEKALIAECEKDAGHRCNVYGFYGGVQYQLIKQMEIRDVRLVHAPADGVGKFGGDTDNWMWPRHTGDYSFYRAYVGPDGKPADYNKDNKPYQSKSYLKLASSPLKENDFVMVTGYPGRTNRYRLPAEVDFTFSWQQPTVISAFENRLAIIKAETEGRKDAELKYASTVAGLNNTMKNFQGQQESYIGSDILDRKQKGYAQLKAWVNGDAKRAKEWSADFATAEKLIAERQVIAKAETFMTQGQPTLLGTARTLLRLAEEQTKPNVERKAGFQERDLSRIAAGLQSLERRYDEKVDKAVAASFLAKYLAQPASTLNATFLSALGLSAGMNEAAIKARLDVLYAGTKLADVKERMGWMKKAPADFKASDDAFIKAAVALYADDEARENRDKELGGRVQQAYSSTMKALIAYKASRKEPLYPDANSTLRVSFGKVTGRTPGADGSNWTPFTTLAGVSAKATGTGEFNAPAAQLAAIKGKQYDKYAAKELGNVPVNFLATLDTTGGNSGSPVLNSKAELVGLLFDGTLDAVIADVDFNPKMVRSIVLDARYMQWQMKVVDKADHLLKEMGAL
ncbi:S46 family peptidase [Pelomonas sp. SE-A7]|uniref:S46 family peptidase n=1 Tax=Pelomonas sp. SE-A7 TaxID=3054953 RepID=UPI00259CE70F|nr:S46 family peptidase [Pelomonas sp. SE-A7]MDM4765925.1 S46 family peptidase [Pelomonas sp. SE-A7]